MEFSDLAEWLREQIAEDRRTAKQLLHPSAYGVEGIPKLALEWGRIRILAECDAKERIIGAYDARHGRVSFGDWESCSDECPVVVLDGVLRLLAQPYAERPGYREEWALPPPVAEGPAGGL
jgi:hypothetical protein